MDLRANRFSDNRDNTPVRIPDGSDVNNIAGDDLYSPIIGTLTTKTALPAGSGKGPNTYIVDISDFGASSIYFIILFETGSVQYGVDIQYSNDGQSGNAHPGIAETLIASGSTGNANVIVPKKDNFAHITITQGTGTAEDIHAYVTGREIA